MRIILLADIHARSDNLTVTRLSEIGQQLGHYDQLWVLGDFFDKSPSSDELLVVNTFLNTQHDVYYINGNHERNREDVYKVDDYIKHNLLNLKQLPPTFKIHNTTFNAVPHKDIHKNIWDSSDILLSHFRWTHSLYGDGELAKADEAYICSMYKDVLLGDIHYRYNPVANVKYVGSPYNIHYGLAQNNGYIQLDVTEDGYTYQYVDLDCTEKLKISVATLSTTPTKHLYKCIVHTTLEESTNSRLLLPKLPNVIYEYVVSTVSEVTPPIQDSVSLTFLSLVKEEDKEYLLEVIKEEYT